MKYRKLGKTGMTVSEITFGCWELGGGQWEKMSDERNIRVIRQALEMGVQSFDTAEGYGQGHSEEVVAEALGGRRNDVVLATKVSPNHLRANDVRTSAENSLKRLRTDFIDIYYIHWPNNEIPLSETMGELNRLKEKGWIRAIGASNFSIGQLKEAMSCGRVDVIQPEYSLLHRGIEKEIAPYCEENGIAIMSYSSIAKGILTGVYHDGTAALKETDFRQGRRLFQPDHLEKATPLVQAVRRIAEARGVSTSEVAIAWLLGRQAMTSAIVGTQNEKHLAANVRAVELRLAADESGELDRVSRDVLALIDG